MAVHSFVFAVSLQLFALTTINALEYPADDIILVESNDIPQPYEFSALGRMFFVRESPKEVLLLDENLFPRQLIIQDTEVRSNFNYELNATVNHIIDDLLNAMKKKYSDIYSLGDAEVSFKKGFFKAWKGWLKGLNTVYRSHNATITPNHKHDSFTIRSPAKLAAVRFGYNSYQAKYSILKFKGYLDGSVGNNAATLQITMKVNNVTCTMSLGSVQVSEISGISVSLSGLGIWKKLVMKNVNKMISNYSAQFKSGAESIMQTLLQDVLGSYDCNKFIIRE